MRRLLTCLTAAAVTCGGFVATASPAAAADPASGSFSTLTYNVAGLPSIISSASTPRDTSTTTIGQRIAPYDIVHVEEDFNYHANLYAADTAHAYRTPTSGGAGIGSGLNTLSKLPYDEDDFERVRWNSCQWDSGDCLTPKGFTFTRQRLAEGVYVDFYNLHTNAGTNPGDLASRADNLNQLTAFIKSHSAGNAVVVMGDTNTRYTRSADTIAEFGAANGLTDAWVQLIRGGTPPTKGSDALVCDQTGTTVPNTCEIVDKILYRGSKLVSLNATSYNNEHAKFLTDAGLMLSDHDPVAVGFSWSRNADFQLSDQFGGPHGDYYNDIDAVPAGCPPGQPHAAQRLPCRQRRPDPRQRQDPHPRRHRWHGVVPDPGRQRVRHLRPAVPGGQERPHPDLLRQVQHEPRQEPVRRQHHVRLRDPHRAHRLADRRLPGTVR